MRLASRHPWIILVAIFIVAAVTLASMNAFIAVVVNDTKGYAEFDFSSLSAALSERRTPGYPLLLLAIRSLTGDYAGAPVVHFALFCGGVVLLHAGLLAHGFSRASSPWIAGSILSSYILGRYVATLATDTTAAALGIGCCGALLLWTAGLQRGWLWGIVTALLVAAAWLVRPIMLSLVPLVCVAGPLSYLRRRGRAASFGEIARYFRLCVAVTVIPLVAWCGLRWQVVGKFGVVSFGGYNLIGVAGQFLDDEMVEKLPENLRPLAQAGLRRRQALPPGEIGLPDDPILRYSRMELNYDVTIWNVFAPAAEELYQHNAAEENTRLKELGIEIVRLRPDWYCVWLAKAARQALRMSCQELVGNPVTGPLIVMTVVVALLGIVKRWRRPDLPTAGHIATGIVGTLFVMAVLYATFQLLLVIAVCPPLGRMTDAACVLFPALVTAVFFDRLSDLWSNRAAA